MFSLCRVSLSLWYLPLPPPLPPPSFPFGRRSYGLDDVNHVYPFRLAVESMNLGFKSKLMRSLFARIKYAVESYVESYVESSMEPRCKRRFECVKVVPLSRYSTVLRALFRDDQVVTQPTMITLPTLPTLLLFLLSLLLLLSLASSALSKLSFFFLITSDLIRHFGATSASLRIGDRAFTQPLCSQVIHRL